MLDLSLAGLIGATLGTVVAGLVYGPLASRLTRRLRARAAARGAEEARTLEDEMPLLLRAVLAIDIAVFAGIGYWLGARIAD
jgi:Na+/glutamate symporter